MSPTPSNPPPEAGTLLDGLEPEQDGLARGLAKIQRLTYLVGALMVGLAWFIWGTRAGTSAAVGALLGVVNFAAVRFVASLVTTWARQGGGKGPVVLLLLPLKLGLLAGLVVLAVRGLDLAVIPFALGISNFVGAILCAGLAFTLGFWQEGPAEHG